MQNPRLNRSQFQLQLVSVAILCCLVSGCRVTSMGQNTLGVRLYQQGRYTEALQQFQTAQTSDPTNPDTYYNLASTYHKMGVAQKEAKLIEQAESLYNQCLDLQPNHVDCHRGLAVLLAESKRPDRAMALLKNWAAKNPQLSDARIELSRLHQEFGQTKVAEQYLDEALALNPNDYRAWTAKGQMRESSGNLEDLKQALQNYQHSLAINSLQPEIYQRVASLNVRMAQNTLSTIGQPGGQSTPGAWTVSNPNPNAATRY